MTKTTCILGFMLSTVVMAETPHLRTELQPLGFLLDACWAGTFPDGVQKDTHCFKRVFNGQHIRDVHVVRGGKALYQGETLYSWDGANNTIAYVYWNSLGGVSTGTATPMADGIHFPDESYTSPDGQKVVVSTRWENITTDGYDSLTVERYSNGQNKERRLRYHKITETKKP
ncbi:hypothetical protein [Marinicella sp. W31]|uniref:hypothetical protein n=1 Tax=Marinicella sp. W31 TaxID=3023713 RepID=UPI0037562DC7